LRVLLAALWTFLAAYGCRVPSSTRLGRRPLRLRTQAVLFQGALLTIVLALCLVVSSLVLRRDLEGQFEQRALAIARSVAQDEGLAGIVLASAPTADGPVQVEAEKVRRATQALYVVVTNDSGVRYSHPNRSLVGQRVSTDPSEALAGRELIAIQRGTLGDSARGKVPLRAGDGAVVGEVSVGISMVELNARMRELTFLLVLIAAGALTLGVLGALTLARRLRRTTLGLEPEEMADLLREHAAVLGGVREGIIAIDHAGRVTVCNPEATRLLGAEVKLGEPLASSGAPQVIEALFAASQAPLGELRAIEENLVIATRLPVQREGQDLGMVLILRDRSDLDQLGRELEATRALTDALRAQAHEYTNRLHALNGMLHLGHVAQAQSYLEELHGSVSHGAGVEDPYLAGLLAAKSAAASEAGVRLTVGDPTWVAGCLSHPLDVVTVVGNLVDNAVRAARDGDRRPAWAEVTLVSDEEDLLIHVVDSGEGVTAGEVESVFTSGFTTRDVEADQHGLGLGLARQTARQHGGDVVLEHPGDEQQGAVFTARMVDVITSAAEPSSRPTDQESVRR
jgi:two-component system, CitB family, sensor kinase